MLHFRELEGGAIASVLPRRPSGIYAAEAQPFLGRATFNQADQ
jgi:hypothetical protein